ncbi:MAG: hypothetical protein A3D27_03235 [Omnitrophica WOR_2 bacterium RIFCSPHIGHO2_02_FULL_46_37]|nr:MAG: hypothetical protein A3D27_03235 [Omnitrophica WOR_2 bacterium RIFCSPHIGHO2_02_FULL_46_37]
MNSNRIARYQPQIYLLVSSIILILLLLLPIAFNINILSGLLLVSFILYFRFSPPAITRDKRHNYLVLIFLFVLFLFSAYKLTEYRIPAAYIPVTALAMYVTIFYNDLKLVFAFCVLASYHAGIIAGSSLYLSLIFLITAMATAILVFGLRKRSRILSAGCLSGIIQSLLYALAYPPASFSSLAPNFYSGIICAIVVAGTLPVLENLFGVVTNISLLELSDFNHPLLKKMILEAPGTYHHSLVVGNLAERAAESIGANSLLARIGAYYHDIGKLTHPEYFMENQRLLSKHAGLAPSMSKMIIMNHVKEGIELARKYRLKPAIIDFITQHHGNGLVYYFYRKALEEIEQDEKIYEEGFRYPGPRPTSKETAIVLLADSVEAASRVISEPKAAKIEEVVHKVINNKFIDGQLDDCELTLKDLEKIAQVFTHMLSGIYHGRIEYPEGNHHKQKGSRAAAFLPGQDKKLHPENL